MIRLLAWCVLMVLPSFVQGETLAEWAKKSEGRQAHGLFIGGKKAGWIVEDWKVVKEGDKELFEMTNDSYTATLYEGEKSVKRETTVVRYELSGAGAIWSATVKRREDGKESSRKITRVGKELKIVSEEAGKTLTRSVPLSKDTLQSQIDLEKWLVAERKAGDKFAKPSATWERKDIDANHEHIFKQKKTITIDGKKTTVTVVSIDIDGGELQAQFLSNGRIHTASQGDLVQIKPMTEEEAKKGAVDLVDLEALVVVPIERRLRNAKRIEQLELLVTGTEGYTFRNSHRQIAEKGKDGVVLLMKADFRTEKADPLSKKERKKNLEATPRLQSEDKTMIALAKKIIGEETEPLNQAKKLNEWVYATLKKSYSETAETALEVLDRKAGACKEHTLLFVSLARAAGIPTREVGGLAYSDSSKPAFGWHAWAEFHDGHQWVSVDPTWGQFYTDATHIKFSDSNEEMAWSNLVGKIKIRVTKVVPKK